MKWLNRFASSQKNIDCVAKYFGGALVVFGLVLAFVLVAIMIFR
jgi:hypothetical protein